MTDSVFSRLKTLIEGYAGLTGVLKGFYINVVDQFAMIPDVATPCVILNDGGEEFEQVGAHVKNPAENVVRRIYKVDLYCIIKYDSSDAIIIGDSSSPGIVAFSGLVEDALLSNETLTGAYHTLELGNWEPVVISSPEAPQIAFAVGRKMSLRYMGKPEAM